MIPAPSTHTITAAAAGVNLKIESARITLDEQWTPYVQTQLVCAVPADYKTIDPRQDQRLIITITHTLATGGLVSTATYDLTLRTRAVDRKTATMTLTAESDEALMQDFAKNGAPDVTTTAGTIQAYIAARTINAVPGSTIVTAGSNTLPVPYVWNPGTSAWDAVAGLVTLAGLRLYSLGGKAFQLAVAPVTVAGTIVLSDVDNVKLATDDLTRNGTDPASFADHVVVEYRWTDTTVTPNVQRVQWDSAGVITAPRKSIFIKYPETRPPAAGGAAAAILARARTRGRNVSVTAISDYTATPGKTVTMTLAGDTPLSKVIRSVQWRFSAGDDDATMTLTTRDA